MQRNYGINFKSLIRPVLDFGNIVWAPSLRKCTFYQTNYPHKELGERAKINGTKISMSGIQEREVIKAFNIIPGFYVGGTSAVKRRPASAGQIPPQKTVN